MSIPRLTPGEYTVARLADLLLEEGAISKAVRAEIDHRLTATEQRLLKARASSPTWHGSRTEITPPEILASMHLSTTEGRALDEDRLMQSVSRLAGLAYRKIDPLKLDHQLVTSTLSRPFARRHACLPLSSDEQGLTIAVDNPFDQELLYQLTQLTGGRALYVVAAKSDIMRIITEIYGFRQSIRAAEQDIRASLNLGNLEQLVRLKKIDELEANDQHIVNAVEYLLHYAYDQRASDIHMEPSRENGRVRLRIDGLLHEVFHIPMIVYRAMVSRIKTLARMDIAERRRPQDGRIKTAVGDTETELRVSAMPVAFGEKLVLRIFDPAQLFGPLEQLGLDAQQLELFRGFLSNPHGMLLVTGPTGSGKTTTLYSTLRTLASPEVNIMTVEDPIEMVCEQFNQVLVQRKIELDFANALRSILRQDPDVIMIGEIRDPETAQMAVQAALTGHLVLSTLHTNDTASAITRLRDLGVPPFLISSTLLGVVAQRLLRLVCNGCARARELTPAQAAALEIQIPPGSSAHLPVRLGDGCPRCRDTGLFGRTGVFEVLPINDSIRKLIREDADATQIYRAARADGMVSLRESAIRHLAEGRTPFEEVVRVLGES
ncbi:MAG: Flp pilus assembly complex ATPase component TadA [Bradymonadales bacterium]|nr:Flp pilus assembly complex ATPase component TadA [Bradymonadales bacterium]